MHDGDRLPSTRTLAATFGLARTAVVGAYEELTAAGFLVARPGGSTYVEQGAAAAARAGAFGARRPGASGAGGLRAARPPGRPAGHAIRYDLRPGQADPALIAERDWTRAMRLAAAGPSPAGPRHLAIRAKTCAQLAATCAGSAGWRSTRRTSSCSPASASALRAVAVTCGLAGQPVAFEDPGYAKARLALAEAGAVIRPVPVDDDGIRAEDLRGSDRACYVTPAHQFPLGGRMPVRRRAGLLEWARGRRRPGAGGRLRRGVPLRRPAADPAAGHARGRRPRGLLGDQLEDPVPRAARVVGRAARPVPRRDDRATWTPQARRSARCRPPSWPASSPPVR